MAKDKRGQLATTFTRRERGSSVPFSIKRVTLRDGSSGIAHGLDLSNAEIPDKTYFGEATGAVLVDDTVRVMFCQPKLGGVLRSLVLVVMPPSSAMIFSKSLGGMKNPSVEEIIAQTKISPKRLFDLPVSEPEQTAVLTANVVAVAIHGHESCLDFYHVNAFAHFAAQSAKANQINLEPIVRIIMNTGLLLALKHRLDELESELRASGQALEEVENVAE